MSENQIAPTVSIPEGCYNQWSQTWWLKPDIYSLKVLELRSPSQSVGRTMLFAETTGEILFLASLSFSSVIIHSNLCLPSSYGFDLISVSLLCISLIRTLIIGLTVHADNPGWSHLKILNLIIYAKTIFTNKVKFTGLSTQKYLFGGNTIQPTTSTIQILQQWRSGLLYQVNTAIISWSVGWENGEYGKGSYQL